VINPAPDLVRVGAFHDAKYTCEQKRIYRFALAGLTLLLVVAYGIGATLVIAIRKRASLSASEPRRR
jgi:hypothetical protein